MSNRNERNRRKRKGRIQKLLGEGFSVDSYYGNFMAYKYNSADMENMQGIRIYLNPLKQQWNISSPALGIEWTGTHLRDGVKLVHAACLLVS